MTTLPPYRLIAALRQQRGETLSQFAAVIGCSSKSRVSEFENGKAMPTVAQALRLEELSGGSIDAATLNADVAAARRACLTIDDGEPGTWKDAISHSPNLRVEDYVPKGEAAPATADPAAGHAAPGWALSDAELDTLAREAAAEPVRVIICDVCEARLDDATPRACTFVDCPHAVRNAA